MTGCSCPTLCRNKRWKVFLCTFVNKGLHFWHKSNNQSVHEFKVLGLDPKLVSREFGTFLKNDL